MRGFIESGYDPPSPPEGNKEGNSRTLTYVEAVSCLAFSL